MKPDERTNFLKWYDDRMSENYVFDFHKEIIEYCPSDVDILRRGIKTSFSWKTSTHSFTSQSLVSA